MKCTNQREAYDRLLQPLNHKDPDGYITKCFDILKGGNQSSFHPFDLFIPLYLKLYRKMMISQSLQLWLILFYLIKFVEILW